ncbi:MAG: CRTAC1 family protein [Myxococcota bacterium]
MFAAPSSPPRATSRAVVAPAPAPDLGVDAGAPDLGPSLGFREVARFVGLDHDQDPNFPATCTIGGDDVCDEGWQTGGVAAGDLDGDGWPDLFFTVMGGPDRLYLNDGDGTFTDVSEAWGVTLHNRTSGVAMHDVDRDGDLDVFTSAYGDRRHYLWINRGDRLEERGLELGATPIQDRALQGQSVGFGDADGDGWPDLYVVEWVYEEQLGYLPRSRTMLLRSRFGEGVAAFEDVTARAGVQADGWPTLFGRRGSFGLTPVFSDLDDDGRQDLYVAADFGASRLFWNVGGGRFQDGTEAAGVNRATNAMGLAVADVDGDLDLDLLVTSIATQLERFRHDDRTGNRLYLQGDGRAFDEAAFERGISWGQWGWGVALADLDHDGDVDAVQTSGYVGRSDGREFFFENDGLGGFREKGRELGFGARGQGRALVLVDVDRDGDDDVLVVRHDDAPVLWRNDLPPPDAHWVRLRVLDVNGADALGARVRVRLGERRWIREVRASGVFNGSHEPGVHVGLGVWAASCAVDVSVHFPAGSVLDTRVACDAWHVLRERG